MTFNPCKNCEFYRFYCDRCQFETYRMALIDTIDGLRRISALKQSYKVFLEVVNTEEDLLKMQAAGFRDALSISDSITNKLADKIIIRTNKNGK